MSALREVSNLTNAVADPKQRQASRYGLNSVISSQDSYRGSQRSNATYSTLLPSQPVSFSGSASENAYPPSAPPPAPRASQPSAARSRLAANADARHANEPTYCTDLIEDITDSFFDSERAAVRRFNEGTVAHQNNVSALYGYYASPHYLQYQPEVNEKMRMILIDWLIDVHLKFKLHPETMFLAVNLIDRYLSCVNTKHNPSTYIPRAQLQLVGVCGMLLAAKYEEIWPPEVKECVHISANTYTREEVIQMERNMCAALSFRLTVPTAFPFASRLWSVLEGEDFLGLHASDEECAQQFALLRHATGFFLEHALLDYKCLQFTPSQVGNAAVFLALVTLRMKYDAPLSVRVWTEALQHYGKAELREFRGCAEMILEFVSYVPTTKYQAVRRKFSSSRYGEVAKLMLPSELPEQ